MKNWLSYSKDNSDIVLSSRVRLARNLNKVPFPNKATELQSREVVETVKNAFFTSSHMKAYYETRELWKADEIKNKVFLEKHLISPKLLMNTNRSAFISDSEETVSLMINEEDHIRLQCITGGLDLEDAYSYAERLDNLLAETLDYAFREDVGYLTACPTNLGTGMRASVMVHLPALTMNNEMDAIAKAISQIGMTIRGLYGEGSKAQGNIYQISNQITLGVTEEEIISNINGVMLQIRNEENAARDRILKKYRHQLDDKMHRSLGVLKSATLLSFEEAQDLMSYVRMAVEMGIINNIDKALLNNLLIQCGDYMLEASAGKKLSELDKNLKRARLVKENFK